MISPSKALIAGGGTLPESESKEPGIGGGGGAPDIGGGGGGGAPELGGGGGA